MSDETNCIGTGKILALPKLTGNLKVDLDNFESIENQNLFFSSTEHSSISSKTDNHPNKHPDTFNKQINLNLKPGEPLNNVESNQNQINNSNDNSASNSAANPTGNQPNQISSSISQTSTTESPTKSSSDKSDEKNKTVTNYEAPYVKIFPLTPVTKNTESITPNQVAFNNYAILTNKLVNSSASLDKTNKSLIESLGFGVLNNRSTEMPKQEGKPIKINQMKTPDTNNKSKQQMAGSNNVQNSLQGGQQIRPQNPPQNALGSLQNSSAQALNGQELANEKKNQPKKTNEPNKAGNPLNKTATSIDVSNKSNRPALAFSISSLSLPKATEATAVKQEGSKKGKSKDNDFKKINCRRPDKRNTTECLHCSYGLFRCSMGKCVITSFECGSNMTNTTRGRRIAVNVNDFLQFV